jgi:hypothetical protein
MEEILCATSVSSVSPWLKLQRRITTETQRLHREEDLQDRMLMVVCG